MKEGMICHLTGEVSMCVSGISLTCMLTEKQQVPVLVLSVASYPDFDDYCKAIDRAAAMAKEELRRTYSMAEGKS